MVLSPPMVWGQVSSMLKVPPSATLMSALGQKRTFAAQKGMSALPPKADIDRHCALPNPSRSRTSNQSPLPDSAKREFFRKHAETFRANSEFWLEFGKSGDQLVREKPDGAHYFNHSANQRREAGLTGWRSSADGPLLCPFSLLTGNFTGNFAKSQPREHR
jgi:hypothetical protein